jgi:hypothetical protein
MSNEKDSNYVSIGSWMGMQIVTAIPVIGLIMVFVWAFSGDNQSRKNYYRAILCWILLFVLLVVGLTVALNMTGHMHDFQQRLQNLSNKPV